MRDPNETLSLLKTKIEEIEALKAKENDSKLAQWQAEVKMILEKLLGDESKYFHQFDNISYLPHVWNEENKHQRLNEAYVDGLDEAKAILTAVVFGIEQKLI